MARQPTDSIRRTLARSTVHAGFVERSRRVPSGLPKQSTDSPTRGQVDRESILRRYLELLAAHGSPLVTASGEVTAQVRAQLYGVVDAVTKAADERCGVTSETREEGEGTQLSEAIGRTRATSNIHPSQSLQAASLIFEAALPTIAARLAAAGDPEPELAAGLLLNREILRRMAEAARAYVDLLLDKAQNSNRDERRRLSRELHDVAAPSVAIGLQNLELFDVYAGDVPEKAAAKIQAARQSLLDALATIRSLAAQSREAVGANGLAEAIRRFLDTVDPNISRSLTVRGDADTIALSYAEELFLIIREAVRNAVDHGQPTSVIVDLEVIPGRILAKITDDGSGFTYPPTDPAAAGVGIASMHERAELLGAVLRIRSTPGSGTEVTVEISVPGSGQLTTRTLP